jgi:hypothetical protein
VLKKIFQLVTGLICGYLFIKWVPISFPFDFSSFLVELVLEPVTFFAAMVVLIIGFIANADLIHDGVVLTFKLLKKEEINILDFALSYALVAVFLLLFKVGFVQTAVFFCLSLIYGIISIDFKKINFIEK